VLYVLDALTIRRSSRELAFTNAVQSIVTRGGSCLIPVFALGRAQELLLILDEYWQEHAHLQVEHVLLSAKYGVGTPLTVITPCLSL
jgi:Cft2 family RNA processing exonuclease